MPDEVLLRVRARAAIQDGKLPSRRPDRTWGGPGVGALRSAQLQKDRKTVVLKADKAFEGFALIKLSRLSVVPASPAEFAHVLELGETKL